MDIDFFVRDCVRHLFYMQKLGLLISFVSLYPFISCASLLWGQRKLSPRFQYLKKNKHE